MIWLLGIAFGLLIGTVLGLLGGGGALISIPILLYGFHFSFSVAVATSLLLVTLGAIPGLILYWRKQEVDWVSAVWMGVSGGLGAWIGSNLSSLVPPEILLNLLILLILVSAWRLVQSTVSSSTNKQKEPSILTFGLLVVAGLLIGILTGLVGVGGGFLIVPALVLIRHLEPRRAIATSLVIIFFNALSGTLGYGARLPLDQPILYGLISAATLGSLLGAKLSYKLNATQLKKGFAFLLIIIACVLIFNPPTH